MKRSTVIVAAVLVLLVLITISVMSLDEPEYRVLEQADGFELREYQPFVVAETRIDGTFDDASRGAFRILVGYIHGNNEGGRNLPMTAPVNQQPIAAGGGERIARGVTRTAPMRPGADGAPGTWLFQFVMPKEYSLPMLPKPVDEQVTLRRIPERLVAARRYSGGWGEEKFLANEQALLDALPGERLTAVGAPTFARYNAPFVPGFLRRNEVLVEVERR